MVPQLNDGVSICLTYGSNDTRSYFTLTNKSSELAPSHETLVPPLRDILDPPLIQSAPLNSTTGNDLIQPFPLDTPH